MASDQYNAHHQKEPPTKHHLSHSVRTTVQSFKYASAGIKKALKSERNFRIQLGGAVVAIALSVLFGITAMQWVVVVLLIGLVLALELLNTALETLVDMITLEHDAMAERVKDVSAAAVLIFSIIACIIGAIIFIPYVWGWMQSL